MFSNLIIMIYQKLYSNTLYKLLFFVFVLLFSGCATFKLQKNVEVTSSKSNKDVVHTFFIAGGLGNSQENYPTSLLNRLERQLSVSGKETTLLFTGDNISPKVGNWEKDKELLKSQLRLTAQLKGKTVFIPGNNEWKSFNSNRVEQVEDFIKDQNAEDISFFPENACPIEHRVINETLDLILIDSKWFIANWSRIRDINKKCTDIVTRRRFTEELEGYINDGQGKNIIIAMHHPVFSNGIYSGESTISNHLKPLPILGTFKETVMDVGAFDPNHLNSRIYNYFRIAVSSLAKSSDRITLVSGHEESLQYLSGGNIHQIVSGSLGSISPTKLSKKRLTAIGGSLEYEGKFSHSARGFVKLEYFEDGSSRATFFSENNADVVSMNVLSEFKENRIPANFKLPEVVVVERKILDDPKSYEKNELYKFLWGERYRKYFGESVSAPVVDLDTLYGGLTVVKEGGGHQSFSLRLEDKDGKQYAMRSLRKSALKFLKFKLPGIAFNEGDFQDTWAEDVISDFFTTAHPYMQLTVNQLAKAVGINHSDTEMLYIPKQRALGAFNEDYGDELYFVERRPSEEQLNYKGYRRTIDKTGKITDFESTTDMLEKIKGDESYTIDQRNFIRARLFDMLIGDWDRHFDQWRWIEYEDKNGEKEFMPVPRDRDNAFPRFDGLAIPFIKLFMPNARMWQSYGDDIKNVKWLNGSGNKLDRALLNRFGGQVWVEEAEAIQQQLSKASIDKAFSRLPLAVQDETMVYIKNSLIKRLDKLDEYAVEYSNYLNKTVAITGTEKDDLFEIERLIDGNTRVVVKRLLSDEKDEIIYDREFNKDATKEIWVYGLGDDDEFKIIGNSKNAIKLKIVGGYGDDKFEIENKNKLKVFDWEHEKIEFNKKRPRVQLSNIYKTNSYHWRYFKPNTNIVMPNLGFRTDDGLFVGIKDTYTVNGLNGSPFRQKHQLFANYYFGFEALELGYNGSFANIFPKWNLEVEGYYTSDRYANNFFGIGNETVNNEDGLGRDFYRARLRQLRASIGIAYYSLRIKGLVESFRVNENEQRFFNPTNFNPEVFDNQTFVGGELSGDYDRTNANDFPTKAIYIGLKAGYKQNTDLSDNRFGYASLRLGFDHKLIPSGHLVLSSTAKIHTNIAEGDIFFYHAPSIGGDNGLRGFRDERFSGRTSFYQSTDLKLRLKRYITAVSPVTIGIYGGFDYGRVWEKDDTSNIWHTSQGGGFWISSLQALSFNIGYFNSIENNLVQVGFGLAF